MTVPNTTAWWPGATPSSMAAASRATSGSPANAETVRGACRRICRHPPQTHFIAARRASISTSSVRPPEAARRAAHAVAMASVGPALPSRWARANASSPARSLTTRSCTYVSRPSECAKPPVGNSPSASWSTASRLSVLGGRPEPPMRLIMTMTAADRHEHGPVPLPRDGEPGAELLHRGRVGDGQARAVEGEGEVTVADLEGHAQRLLARARRHREHDLLGGLDDDVPVVAHVDDLAGRQHGSRRQGERQLAARARPHAPPAPPPLLRRENEGVALQAFEGAGIGMYLHLGDDDHRHGGSRCDGTPWLFAQEREGNVGTESV